jgi:hypothetical protein
MTPTPKLRFVERKIYVNKTVRGSYRDESTVSELVKKTILQQWWEPERNIIDAVAEKKTQGEWRDVPLEWEA